MRYPLLLILCALGCAPCGAKHADKAPAAPPAPVEAPVKKVAATRSALLVAASVFPVVDGKAGIKPGPAEFEVVTWDEEGQNVRAELVKDEDSNVFHKVLAQPKAEPATLLSLGGTAASVKRWRRDAKGLWQSEKLWQEDFGGRFSRMRDAEWLDAEGTTLVVGTHDQGLVATLEVATGTKKVLMQRPNTFIHEVEVGDLDGDGKADIVVTPSEPNKLAGGAQSGQVLRLDPAGVRAPEVLLDLGTRHAKEVLVADVDGDGRDELYTSVEWSKGAEKGEAHVSIRRTDFRDGAFDTVEVARLPDTQCRFLTVGDVDGDGKQEMVAAAMRSGLWLLRPAKDPHTTWVREAIDEDSSGFEHAALLADLDGDARAELYVAADDQGELRRYSYRNGRLRRSVLLTRSVPKSRITWNLMALPLGATQP